MLAIALMAAAGPSFGTGKMQVNVLPPQPYNEHVILPGTRLGATKELVGTWQYEYRLAAARIQGASVRLHTIMALDLRDDGTYHLLYTARWGPEEKPQTHGTNVEETGRYSLSGEVLLLQPTTSNQARLDNNKVKASQAIANESHVWITHAGNRQLHVGGRCASYQVDPACHASPTVWFSLTGELSSWLML